MLSTLERSLLFNYPRLCRMYGSSATRKFDRQEPPSTSVKPVRVQRMSWQDRYNKWQEHVQREARELKEFEKDFIEELDTEGDIAGDPDLRQFRDTVDDGGDEERLRDIKKRRQAFRKHFRHLQPKEVSLLTWAEKETVRYLLESDPNNWSPEKISEAFPISAKGAEKLMRSTFKPITLNTVIRHDKHVLEKIEKIKSGEIPMTEELERKVELREKIPLKIGDPGMNAHEIVVTGVPKVVGDFTKLVATPKELEELRKTSPYASDHCMQDGDLVDPNQITDGRKIEMTGRELGEILPRPRKLMTFGEFEKLMARKSDQVSEDMKYMLSLNNNEDKPAETVEDDNEIQLASEQVNAVGFTGNDSIPSKSQRLKEPTETGQVTVSSKEGEAYIYTPETGYQKPFAAKSDKIPQSIDIPDELYKPGATYKVNDCYYDENGEFLYRVV